MCGIAGVCNLNGEPVSSTLLKRMSDSLAHRGPDGDGQFAEGPIGLGHRRQDHAVPDVEICLRCLYAAALCPRDRVSGDEPRELRRQLRARRVDDTALRTADVGDDGLRRESRRDACEDVGGRAERHGDDDDVRAAHGLQRIVRPGIDDAEFERAFQIAAIASASASTKVASRSIRTHVGAVLAAQYPVAASSRGVRQ